MIRFSINIVQKFRMRHLDAYIRLHNLKIRDGTLVILKVQDFSFYICGIVVSVICEFYRFQQITLFY